ncbi:DUF1800 domain-containing protein [Frateuria defendens]|uniref:DUF1800 domain-containing protein n=1 Tax=Frateuria defendens TaxID=2219559 RepID=UPI00066FD600|nr:DUF1800 domain-containing protein [Frateuria defendens]
MACRKPARTHGAPTAKAPRTRRRAGLALALALLPLLASARGDAPLAREDIAWLRRDGFGLDAAAVARYHELGRSRLLAAQLDDRVDGALPPAIAALLAGYPAQSTSAAQRLADFAAAQARIKAMPDGDARLAARNDVQKQGNQLMQQAQQAALLHAVYGPNQLKEQLVWFWLNHFSVYAPKGRVRWEVADYAERAIRPHALGKFRDLVMATLQSPAMLEFLDNAQNAKGHVNENYARELMELHTLGVNGGYTQQDVQQLALILTGVGIAPVDGKPERFNPKMAPLVVHDGLFEFNPNRHDFGDKTFLGHPIKGSGYDEVRQAVDLIVRQPSCAQFVSHRLAEYFVADQPPPKLVERMARTFRRSDGDIAKVLRTLFESKELTAGAGAKFKDPTQFVVSAMRLAYDGKPIANALPLVNWLNQLGEPLYGRITPDGWPLDGAAWSSSGQMEARFEIARSIGYGNNQLFTPPGATQQLPGFPLLTTRLYYEAVEPGLGDATRNGLAQARSQQEWNAFLLASPDFNHR